VKKISSLFARDPNDPRILTDDFHPDAAWVIAGEGVATRKWDGTAVLVREGRVFARYDVKRGKTAPRDFEPAQDPDPITGKQPGWIPAMRPEDKWIREALVNTMSKGPEGLSIADGTYEACGPKIGGNPEGLTEHLLIRHGRDVLDGVPRDKAGLVEYFRAAHIEGVVWWREPGNDACDKIKIIGEYLGVRRLARAPVDTACPSRVMITAVQKSEIISAMENAVRLIEALPSEKRRRH